MAEAPIDYLSNQPNNTDGIPLDVLNATGGGGGGVSTTFVPPSYTQSDISKPLIVNLVSKNGTAVEWLEDGVSQGIGPSARVVHNPSIRFGSKRTYNARLNGGQVLSYFEVSIEKIFQKPYNDVVYNPYTAFVNPASSMFGGMNGNSYMSGYNAYDWNFNYGFQEPISVNDSLYEEGIVIREYTYQNGGWAEGDAQKLWFTDGAITLNFNIENVGNNVPSNPIVGATPITISEANPLSEYEIVFSSNFKNELGNSVYLSYQIVSQTNDIVKTGTISLSDGNVISTIDKNVLNNGTVNFQINGTLPDDVSFTNIYNGLASQIGDASQINYGALNNVPTAFSVPASRLRNSLVVIANAERVIRFAEPSITLDNTQFDVRVKDSDTEKSISIPFFTQNADSVLVYLSPDKTISVPASDRQATIYFQRDFQEVYGQKRIIFVPVSNGYGTGNRIEALVTFTAVNDYPSITETTYADLIDIPSFSDFNIEYEVKYSTFSATSVDIFLRLKDKSLTPLFNNQSPNGNLKINLKKLRENYPNWAGSDNISIVLKPYNRGGAEELIGNDYEIVTKLILPAIQIDEDIFGTAIFNAFIEKLSIIEPEKESKYLTHLVNFGNNEQILVSSWEKDNWTLSKKSIDELGNEFVKRNDEVESIILKLYSPLPASVTTNSTFWITKLMTNPLIETVILTEQAGPGCPPLKGPNFSIDIDFTTGQSTNYESLDNMILSGSTSSNNLIQKYLSGSLVNTSDLNIEYGIGDVLESGSIHWNNFVHFSSAKERVDNFVYKVQLIEAYDTSLESAFETGSIGDGLYTGSAEGIRQVERITAKKRELLGGFDGFENFLYTSSSLSWPFNGNVRRLSTTQEVSNWYDTIIDLADEFDSQNQNWVQNNIPQYIVNNEENASLLLFFSMIGQHFDNIYYHTKSIEKSRGLGYKAKDGISDKLLFETLKSFSWDAKNLNANSNLWEYVFGLDSDGNTKAVNPAKQRTYEVWRRIANNLPYLLKHKGTRRGVYALMACYGIPSSNLSILEFGGPEVDNANSKSKLVMDNITTALSMINGSYIEFDWKNTERNRKPDTIEFFVKPSTSGNYQLISGSGWDIRISGSAGADYGKVIFNYSGSNSITSSRLPIFNEQFFGIEVSREVSGSYHNFELNIRQADKERSIFQQSNSASVLATNSNWNGGSVIRLGNNFVGSVDEFRLWSTPLQSDVFYQHVSFPEMVNGNHVSASTDDLFFRLDFEYPKNLATYTTLPNVDTNMYFEPGVTRNDYEGGSNEPIYSLNPSASFSATAVGFSNINEYPYQFEAIDRSVVLEIPDGGSSRYSTNKVRFESQELIGSLSSKSRATKKAFDQSPTDSNRVGLFFSPTKELNIDIAKSLGGLNLDNYIGDPSDRYKDNYNRLDELRKYYFERFDGRDIYAYISLIKLYEKSMFEDIKKMLPARVKATTGLLIEPHFLERSKHKHRRPTGEANLYEAEIDNRNDLIINSENIQQEATLDAQSEYVLSGENNQKESVIDADLGENLTGDNYQYDSTIDSSETTLTSEYYQNETTIDAGLGDPTILTEIDIINSSIVVGQSDLELVGFGLFAQSGSAIRTYFDKDRNVIKERVKVSVIKEKKTRDFTYLTGSVDTRLYTEVGTETYFESYINIQPFTGSNGAISVFPTTNDKIVEVTPVIGYLKTHFRNTSDLTRGLENSFFRGSKNTAATTLDGTSPIETFTTNPNTLRVNKAGRDASEPILEVE
jgi:hypothetical protein